MIASVHFLFFLSLLGVLISLVKEVEPFRIYLFDVFFLPLCYIVLLTKVVHPARLRINLHGIDRTVMLLFVAITLSFCFSYDIMHSVVKYFDWVRIVVFYFVARMLFENTMNARQFERFLQVLAVLLLVVGVIQIITGISFGLVGNYFGENRDQARTVSVASFVTQFRVSGTTSNPIVYALWLNMYCSIIVVRLIMNKNYKWLVLFVCVTMFVMFNTFSRGGIITYIFILIIIIFMHFKRLRDMRLVLTSLLFVLLVATLYNYYALPESVKVKMKILNIRFEGIYDVDEVSSNSRIRMLKGGVELLKEPRIQLFGTGGGNFYRVALPKGLYVAPNKWKDFYQLRSGIHNVFVKVLVEYGIIVFVIFVILLYKFGRHLIFLHRCSSCKEERMWSTYLTSTFVAFILIASQVYESAMEYYVLLPAAAIMSFATSNNRGRLICDKEV